MRFFPCAGAVRLASVLDPDRGVDLELSHFPVAEDRAGRIDGRDQASRAQRPQIDHFAVVPDHPVPVAFTCDSANSRYHA